MKKKQILGFTLLLLLYELIQIINYFNYSYFTTGWENVLAGKIIFYLMISMPFILFFAYRIKNCIFEKILIIINWLIFIVSLVFALFKPFLVSTESYDLFLSQAVYILNPAISSAYIIYISTLTLIMPRAKNIHIKKHILFFVPIILWVTLRLFFVIKKASIV